MLRTQKIPFTGILGDGVDEPFRYVFNLPDKRYMKVLLQHTVSVDNQETVIDDITQDLNLGVADSLGAFVDQQSCADSRIALAINKMLFAVSEDCELQSFPLYVAFSSPMEPIIDAGYIAQFLIVVYKD